MDYPFIVYQETNGETSDWVCEYIDLPGCIGVGDSPVEAVAEAEENKTLWLEEAESAGKSIPSPTPVSTDYYSGKFSLRIPPSLHRDIALRAAREKVSQNQLCTELLAEGIGRKQAVRTLNLNCTFNLRDSETQEKENWQRPSPIQNLHLPLCVSSTPCVS